MTWCESLPPPSLLSLLPPSLSQEGLPQEPGEPSPRSPLWTSRALIPSQPGHQPGGHRKPWQPRGMGMSPSQGRTLADADNWTRLFSE